MLGIRQDYFDIWRNTWYTRHAHDDLQTLWFEELECRVNAWDFHNGLMTAMAKRRIPLCPSVWELDDTWLGDSSTLRYRVAMLPQRLIPEETRGAVDMVAKKVAEALDTDVLASHDDKWFRYKVPNQ